MVSAPRRRPPEVQKLIDFVQVMYGLALLVGVIVAFELVGLGEGGWMWLPVLVIWIGLMWLSLVTKHLIRQRYQSHMARRRATRVTEWGGVS